MHRSKSLRKNLITALSSLIAITLIVIYVISFFSVRNEIQEVFDADLAKSSKVIFGLISHEVSEEGDLDFAADFDVHLQQKAFHRYEYKIDLQAWAGDRLIYSSNNNLFFEKPSYQGFRDVILNQKKWRSFAFSDENSGITILVSEKASIRNKLILEILFSLLIPLTLSFIPLLFIIIAVVNKKLQPLDRFSLEISKMSSQTLRHFKDRDMPSELKPFVNSFNELLDRLNHSMESERRFTDYAAHELKTPLAAIKIQAQLLEKNQHKEKSAEYLHDLIDGINRMSHMISQLLTLVRLEPENNQIEKEKVELKNLAKSVLKNYAKQAEKKEIQIQFEADEKNILIEANRVYLEILIRNLVENAIKYSPENEAVVINISQKIDQVSLRIINRGIKLSKEECREIFNNFYRVSKNNSEENQGCGLGLAISKKIVDLHQGSISFFSQHEKNSVEVLFKL